MSDDWKSQMRAADAIELSEQFQETFKEADEDEDQILNQAEFMSFLEKWSEKITEKFGSSIEFSEEEKQKIFDGNNLFTPDTDGISIEDFGKQKRASMQLQKGGVPEVGGQEAAGEEGAAGEEEAKEPAEGE